jgi:hypothetical protein
MKVFVLCQNRLILGILNSQNTSRKNYYEFNVGPETEVFVFSILRRNVLYF